MYVQYQLYYYKNQLDTYYTTQNIASEHVAETQKRLI